MHIRASTIWQRSSFLGLHPLRIAPRHDTAWPIIRAKYPNESMIQFRLFQIRRNESELTCPACVVRTFDSNTFNVQSCKEQPSFFSHSSLISHASKLSQVAISPVDRLALFGDYGLLTPVSLSGCQQWECVIPTCTEASKLRFESWGECCDTLHT